MRIYSTLETKASKIINFYRAKGYTISDIPITSNTVPNIMNEVNAEAIVIIRFNTKIEVIAPDGEIVPEYLQLTEHDRTSDQVLLANKVYENFLRSGINNPNLHISLFLQTGDNMDEIKMEQVIILEKLTNEISRDTERKSK